MYDICSAVLAINPSAQISVNAEGTENEKITWHGDTAEISKADIQAKQAELKALYDSKAYARSRKAEYDKLNQFELISDDSINGTTTHKDAIVAIKNKYPKG
jgi:hypothetical protein